MNRKASVVLGIVLVFYSGLMGCNRLEQIMDDPLVAPGQTTQAGGSRAGAPVTVDFRYQAPDASEVLVAWGINGWNMLEESAFPAGTFVQNGVMHNPMQLEGDTYSVQIAMPAGVTLDYGFLVKTGEGEAVVDTWDGDYQVALEAGQGADDSAPIQLVHGAHVANGATLFAENCTICHGTDGRGVTGLGKDLVASEFVAQASNAELAEFIIAGRPADDPANTTGIAMPPRGGNAALTDQDIHDIATYIRQLPTMTDTGESAASAASPEPQGPAAVEGFAIEVYREIPGSYLTTLAFAPDGVLYACSYDGTVWAITDRDGDGLGDEPVEFAGDFDKPVGLEWHEGELYVASAGTIDALRDEDGDLRADSTRNVASGFPAGIQPVHANNDLAIGPDGRLYFGVGSTSDASPPSQPYEASILSVNPDGSDLRVVATGVRNSYDVAFNANGDLFAGDNAPDGEAIAGTLPPDELNHIIEGAVYGFPLFFGPPPVNSDTVGPVLTFPVHSAPSGITFYAGDQFPDAYRDDAFVALWNNNQIYRVQLGHTAAGDYVARGSIFASGIDGVVDVAVGPEGALYATSSNSGTIYRIVYTGP